MMKTYFWAATIALLLFGVTGTHRTAQPNARDSDQSGSKWSMREYLPKGYVTDGSVC